MKHPNNRRPIIAVLVLVLILSVLPVTALADTLIFRDIFDTRDGYMGDSSHIISSAPIDLLPNSTESQTISIQDYDRVIRMNGKVYEFMGMGSWLTTEKIPIDNQVESMVIPPFPASGTEEEREAWFKTYGEIALLYGPEKQEVEPEVDPDVKPEVKPEEKPEEEPEKQPETHVHVPYNNQWFYTDTNHYRVCRDCLQYYDMDWHHDRDGDGKCDQCGMTILRYPITVLDCEGGKITVSQKDGVYNDVIEVTVETDPGYAFRQVHFFKLDEQRHELTRWEDAHGARYHFDMPFYDVEIEAEFVKQ